MRIVGIDADAAELDRLLALPVNEAGMLDFIAEGK